MRFNIEPLLQAPKGEIQPSTEIDLFISTEKIMVLNTDLQVSLSFSSAYLIFTYLFVHF